MTEHLKLGHLTSFAARYHLASSVRTRSGAEADAAVLDIIEAETNALAVNKVGLDVNFKGLRESIEIQRRRFGEGISSALALSLDGLLDRLRAHSCCHCYANPKCVHEKETYENVSIENGGKCIQPLKDLFVALRRWVDEIWSDLPHSEGMPSLPVVFATTGRAFNYSQPIIEKFYVSGYARALRSTKGGYYTKVGLEIRERSFGWRQYSLLPYLLLHEILCHAFQGLDKPELRQNAEPTDAWSEGWMDCLAYELALEWLSTHETMPHWRDRHGCVPFVHKNERRDAERQIVELHNARYPEEVSLEGISNPGDGRKVFYQVLDSYPESYKKVRQTRHPVTQFSLRLNAMALPLERRVRDLVRLKHLASQNAPALREVIGNFNGEAEPEVALQLLESSLK